VGETPRFLTGPTLVEDEDVRRSLEVAGYERGGYVYDTGGS